VSISRQGARAITSQRRSIAHEVIEQAENCPAFALKLPRIDTPATSDISRENSSSRGDR
jgi:hypothetical protein